MLLCLARLNSDYCMQINSHYLMAKFLYIFFLPNTQDVMVQSCPCFHSSPISTIVLSWFCYLIVVTCSMFLLDDLPMISLWHVWLCVWLCITITITIIVEPFVYEFIFWIGSCWLQWCRPSGSILMPLCRHEFEGSFFIVNSLDSIWLENPKNLL